MVIILSTMIIKSLFVIFVIVSSQNVVARDLGSLTFVIDVTSSMWNDISEVKLGAIALLDTVLNRKNESQISNFILVTFNDLSDSYYAPDLNTIVNTRDPDILQSALSQLRHTGGGAFTCAELSLAGIKRGLEQSQPKSYIYVFTDATAKDFDKFEEIKGLAQDKQAQIVFGLTGLCSEHTYASPEYKVYQDIASATGGVVFNIKKGEVHNLLSFVNATITGRRTTPINTVLSPGEHNVTLNTDVLMGEILISVTSTEALDSTTVRVRGPDGGIVQQEILFLTSRAKVFSIVEHGPGKHTVEIGTKVPTSLSVSAKDYGYDTDIGFSGARVPSMIATSPRPVPGQKSYISIKLKEGDVTLKEAQLLDMNDKLLMILPLEFDNRTNLYTSSAFDPPNERFRVQIVAYDPITESNITRIHPPIDGQTPLPASDNKSPTVDIKRDYASNINYNESLEIICEVNGYPKPKITWKNKDSGSLLPSETSIKKLPSDFISILKIEKTIENTTYVCEATNSVGADSKDAVVQVIRKRYLNIKAIPHNTSIEYDKEATLVCNVEAYPPASITWYKNGVLLASDDNIEISRQNSTVTFKKVAPADKGNYTCEAKNEDLSKSVTVNATVSGLVPAHIVIPRRLNRTMTTGEILDLTCQASGIPKPQVEWIYQTLNESGPSWILKVCKRDTSYSRRDIQIGNEGIYKCVASNDVGKTEIAYRVQVFDIPVIDKNITEMFITKNETTVLECKVVKGKPKPSIAWSFRPRGFSATYTDIPEWNNLERVILKNSKKEDSGIYLCHAKNEASSDYHEIDLFVEYPPAIKKESNDRRKELVGAHVFLQCNVDGSPSPQVTWYKDNRTLNNSDGYHTSDSHTLIFEAKLTDRGTYVCEASNKLGTANGTPVTVNVVEPATILNPNHINMTVLISDNLSLPCVTKGDPKPLIKWEYQSFGASKPSKRIFRYTRSGRLILSHVKVSDEGYYKCIATNSGGSASITYEVRVSLPPTIQNSYIMKRFEAVDGDLALQIICNATGNPRPTITWTKDNRDLILGTNYGVEEDILIIKNVSKEAAGYYTCIATNPVGTAQEYYQVFVHSYPPFRDIVYTRDVDEGDYLELECPVPYKESRDLVRWYKNGNLEPYGTKMIIENVSVNDAAVYTCRVSNTIKSKSASIKINVEAKPRFTTNQDENVEIFEGMDLDCENEGVTNPHVVWYRNGRKLEFSGSVYDSPMAVDSPGQYRCEVRNVWGDVLLSRTFNITQRDCYINTGELGKLHPLLLSSDLTWPTFKRANEYIVFSKGQQFILLCPSRFSKYPRQYISASCDGGRNILINDVKYDYTEIQCTEEVNHAVQKTGKRCKHRNTEKLIMGYKELNLLGNQEVYEICWDKRYNVPIYSKHILKSSTAEDDNSGPWMDSEYFRMNFEEVYGCKNQINAISSRLGKSFHVDDGCCFSRRQLVSPRDVFPGVPQRATYSYYNVVPHWSTCNVQNWDDIERRVRNFAKISDSDLLVWTGTARHLSVSSARGLTRYFFGDSRGNMQPVPMFLWKVIQDPETSSSLAVIQINVPDLSPSEVSGYILCNDVCDRVEWMRSSNWHDVNRGYTYCCTIEEFETQFRFKGIFEPEMTSLLDSEPDPYKLPGSDLLS